MSRVDLEKIPTATPSGEWMVIPRGDDGSKGWWVAGDDDRCAFNDADTSPETRDYLVALHNAAAAMVAELTAAREVVEAARHIEHVPETLHDTSDVRGLYALRAKVAAYDALVKP